MLKKLLSSIAVITLTCTLIGGATFAYFNDSVSNNGNKFKAGTVTITANRNNSDTVPGPMFYTTAEEGSTTPSNPELESKLGKYPTGFWYPGKTETRDLIVINGGTLAVTINKMKAVVTDGNLNNSIDDTILKNALRVSIGTTNGGSEFWSGTLAEMANPVLVKNSVNLTDGAQQYIYYTVSMPNESISQNVYQGLNIKVDFEISADAAGN